MTGARDQVARLLALAPYLQARREGVPLTKVAADFGVKPEVIVRDLKVLFMCGLPGLGPGDMVDVDFEAFEHDPEGIVRIDNADFLSRPFRLGSSEASALIVALRTLRDSGPADSRAVVDRTLVKLEDAVAGGDTVAVHAGGAPPVDATTLSHLRAAVDEDRQVRLDYYVPTRDEVTERTVDPLSLLERDGHTYLDAWCHQADARRLFRTDRIQSAVVLDQARERDDVAPRDLDAGLFEAADDDVVATVLLEPSMRWFADYYPILQREEAGEGRLRVRLAVGDPQWLVRTTLRLAPGVRVLEPASLADQVANTRASMLALYDQRVR